ncbi:MAG: aspartyl-tRNA amidotransferase [Candidatus Yanofskybacteria bacterium RIFCSPLOWO2_02_FULL_43_10]|uniref:Aspartyl-tRNA amidotransferase n=1 Tax=Candidatus Yanofskybacteria bacterium RIFCSPLOWO2_12_FULL_43_11b TaxID=1802710 RepID=A0A1F8H9X0_9BACT|nr:MAG: aspartyl-tRNA amidotransferase [Candidatus Yanofskybacteria bacterium RIFCSPHIGHO2_01_FULL_43_32]OGN12126.1 MAG: aspartyl-tRNA amidotransferase [Candidatus Yanofskybacteria bacterium RIFCSPHIGHO2_02_FULL_43_12]OGN18264.1 MAG: aspartyl-tRNA amidotransferase [Candidatus Yanofskybacteria bacterium RIFCSPHIGHO2_12_FULL_43_11]OGN25225.1 MAG: aspartyl-tRNA amidotransferase [Candidatus Yanofskybacteria bacterium RIFCSPLOWO2_01_FULL_43_46]OGN29259.1 MAG: aspartyl-tRNA amidotransferase [Candidat
MLKEKLQQDIKDALKSGDGKKRMLLGMVLAAIKNKEIEKRGELSDDDVIAVVASEIKKRRDSTEQYEKGGRPELAEGERKEAEILMAYMPEQMSEEDVRNEVKKTITETGIKDVKEIGKLIGAVMAKVKGKADGQLVSRLVKEELSK